MRIRQVKPDFWRDGIVGKMKDTTRLVYIGLWMVADDAGWFRRTVPEIGTDLFPYLPTGPRERKVEGALVELEEAGRVRSLPCGHSQIEALPKHQRLAVEARRVTVIEDEHRRCVDIPHHSTAARGLSKGNGTVRNVEERERGGTGGSAAEPVGSLAASPLFPPIGSRRQ